MRNEIWQNSMNSQSKFTIARVIARLNIGGPAIQAISMTEAFQKKGYRAILLTGQVPEGEGSMEYLAEEKGVAPIKIGALSRRISWHKDLATLWQLIQIFRRERPLVVHTHTAKAGTLGRLAAIVTRVPVRVHTFHGHVFNGYFSPAVTRSFLAIERFLARHTDCIIAISESQRQDLAYTYRVAPVEKISVVPLGFDLDSFLAVNGRAGTLRHSMGCEKDSFLVGWVGRLTAIKDPDLFLRCARDLAQSFQELRFAVIGDGELRSSCEEAVKSGDLGAKVCFTGWRQQLDRIYADLDLVVLTSINEGTPLSLLEAMASGKAFISTDVGGVRDLMAGSAQKLDGFEIFENGILVPRERDVLARAITYLLKNPEKLCSMGKSGRKFVRARFSNQRLADDLESLYVALVRSKTSVQLESQSLVQGGKSVECPSCSPAPRNGL
jgi:glycosyltransferase involved in cell wall biosynthesis